MDTFGGKQPTPRVARVFEATVREAESYGHDYIGTEHLLLGLLAEQDGVAAKVLAKLGVAHEAPGLIREIIESDGYNQPTRRVMMRPPDS